MNISNTQRWKPPVLRTALLGAMCGGLVVSLAACGGGSSSPSSDGTVSGVVLDGPITGATVCLDLNGNHQCDTGEPASGLTDAQGAYTITGLTQDQRNSGAEWLAMVPAGAKDDGTTFTQPFVLRAPANKPGIISPFSHMVQVAMDQGAGNQAAAESVVAAQLGLSDSASIYANYRSGSPTADNSLLSVLAPWVVTMLQGGQQIKIGLTSTISPTDDQIRSFSYTDPNNYYVRAYYFTTLNGQGILYDVRGGTSSGSAMTQDVLYGTALTLTKQGWVSSGPSIQHPISSGNPSVVDYNGYVSASYSASTSMDGRPIADAVTMANDLSNDTLLSGKKNTEATMVGVPTSLSGTLPADSYVTTVETLQVSNPVAYYPSDGTVAAGYANPALTNLDAVISSFPVTPTPTGGTTLSMGTLQSNSSYSCPRGASSCVIPQQRLRAMLAPSSNSVQWVLCDLNWPAGTNGSCSVIPGVVGGFSKTTGIDGQTPLLTFSGLPTQAANMGWVRVYAEAEGQVWFGFQNATTSSISTRLNGTAFAPIAAQLGITVPANPN